MDRIRHALVTGAGGFIGSHLAEKLASGGIQTRALVRYGSTGSWGWLDTLPPKVKSSIEVVPGDIRDPACVRRIMTGCDVVFHLAALISIPYSYECPQSYLDTNVTGTLNVLQAARDCGTERLVVTSTSEVYGTAQEAPIREAHPLQPQSPYAASKVGADQFALSFYRSYGTPVAIMRPFNTFGPRQSARAVIPSIITQLLQGCGQLRLGSLHPTRDFMFVEDTVKAFLAVAASDKALGQVLHAGSGCEISIGDLVTLIREITGSKAEVVTDDQRVRPEKSEVNRLIACNDQMLKLTDWAPSYSGTAGVRAGLEKTVQWLGVPENARRYRPELYSV